MAVIDWSKKILIEFDKAITSINAQSGFTVKADEPVYSPGGDFQQATYDVESISHAPADQLYRETFIGGSLTDVEVNQGVLSLLLESNLVTEEDVFNTSATDTFSYF